ncbi:Tyrosyl-tRNA synthetase [Acanthamoeba castellanii str. Neff]|uniref:Tyrosyl-tRNA synthetase n=1 Tax=Acanthamoeba castellanii (strain ATCC 30010 / Neff) TaxID=1257118 RepID=L8GFZ7_ACACF|nr:Tyrosyl-tRNA synthetase [Acanthamoeba castellanii str. Neff]ELR11794.1 Tyrosyl-tRNA synthetase [Acanthamoeba castellanii str. Neff]
MQQQEEDYVTCQASFDANELATDHPPRWLHPNKKLVYALACPRGADSHRGTLHYSRYKEIPLPSLYVPDDAMKQKTQLEMREDAFTYEPTAQEEEGRPVVSWYKNFAHSHLFIAYAGGLYAQDEMQVAEHPILASLREALTSSRDKRFRPLTTEGNEPTPILIRGVERRIFVKTDRNPGAGRPYGLYGGAFAAASEAAIRNASVVLKPPTISNILALEAPPGGRGAYRYEKGFESAPPFVVIHTGNWGTGAYGGNKVLMALLQVLAARLAGVDKLVYHTFERQSSDAYREGVALLDERLVADSEGQQKQIAVDELIGKLTALQFRWGLSDGN